MSQLKYKSSIFSIAEAGKDGNLEPGFNLGVVDTTRIIDGDSIKDRDSINKMCTSIPTPFARLFLFRTAFREVQKRQSLNTRGKALLESDLYNYMVSDCLDMLEFIFYYGAQPEFNVIKWVPGTETDMLAGTTEKTFQASPEHKRLANALKSHVSKLPEVNAIYLFTWNDRPADPQSRSVVIGGTSPFSLVYTSPNWVREKSEHNWTFSAGDENINLFDNDPMRLEAPRALSQRSERFRKFIYRLWFAYRDQMESLSDFDAYIKFSWDLYDKNTPFGQGFAGEEDKYTKKEFESDYSEQLHFLSWQDDQAIEKKMDAIVGIIPLRCMKPIEPVVHDDYKIALPFDANLPKESTSNGDEVIERPLVLDKDIDIAGALYYEEKPWTGYASKMPSYIKENKKYWERTLPGTRRKHPYLRIEDFLEDKIIRVGGTISNRHFLTGNAGDVTFLPPLKRLFFKFFKMTDLFVSNNGDSLDYTKAKKNVYSIAIDNDESVTVTLNIPLMCGKSISLSKHYSVENIVYMDDADEDRHFNLSIFPFYRILDKRDSNDKEKIVSHDSRYNKYSVMLGYVGDVKLHFYDEDNLNKDILEERDVDNRPLHKYKERTETNVIKTRYYTINRQFSVIEVEAGGTRGMVIPLFEYKKLGTNNFVFCVDFGTTNTHISYGLSNDTTVNEFCYNDKKNFNDGEQLTKDDEQVVSLFGIGGYMQYKPTFKREFVPEAIVKGGIPGEKVDDQKLSFPIRTTACVSNSWLSDTATVDYQLFGDTNVGFFFLNEEQANLSSNVYKQNIKWARGGKNPEIRQAFFDEIMWLIKNKVVLNEGSMDFVFYFTYPQSMERPEKSSLFEGWAEARKNVLAASEVENPGKYNLQETSLRQPIEGILPWYSFRNLKKIGDSECFLNVDIGGGTMDMVYQDPETKQNYTFSARFAANDLWGDGSDEMSDVKKDNAFIHEYRNATDDFPTATSLVKKYEAFCANATDSSDIVSFLFKYDKDYKFTKHLQKSPLMTLILMHFVATSYYIGLVLKKYHLPVPEKIGFTGMGSLYVKIISPVDREIADIMKSVLRYHGYTENAVKGLEVMLTDNPKVVTARGGVIFHNSTKSMIHDELCVWGFDGEEEDSILNEVDVPSKLNDVLTLFEHYIGYFSSEEFAKIRSKLKGGWKFQPLNQEVLLKLARNSFRDWDERNNKHGKDDVQSDPIFFWPFKDLLYNYGLKILENQ